MKALKSQSDRNCELYRYAVRSGDHNTKRVTYSGLLCLMTFCRTFSTNFCILGHKGMADRFSTKHPTHPQTLRIALHDNQSLLRSWKGALLSLRPIGGVNDRRARARCWRSSLLELLSSSPAYWWLYTLLNVLYNKREKELDKKMTVSKSRHHRSTWFFSACTWCSCSTNPHLVSRDNFPNHGLCCTTHSILPFRIYSIYIYNSHNK